MALSYASSNTIDAVTGDVLEKWQFTLEALERDPCELQTKLNWVAKKMLVEAFMERKGLDWESPRVHMLDLQYHDSRPDKGLYYMLERQDKIERIVSDDEINAAVHTPPSDTRAYFRGECLRRYPGEVFGVNWDSISFGFGDEPIKRIMMSEPLKGTKVYVEELLNKSESAAELLKNMST